MKTKLFFSICLAVLFSSNIFAQTDGKLSVTFTQAIPTTPTIPWNGQHFIYRVGWIQNGTTFVKTNFYGNGKRDHLPTWSRAAGCETYTATTGTPLTYPNALGTACNKNNIDATAGATLSNGTFQSPATSNPKPLTTPPAFGTITYTWDGKDSTGAIVPDATYTVYIESSWSTSVLRDAHDDVYSFTVTKDANINNVTPADGTYITAVSAKWTPTALGTEDVNAKNVFRVFPNPATDNFSVKTIENVKGVNVYDVSGKLVKTYLKSDSYDISSLKPGVYFLEINTATGAAYEKIIKK